MCEACFFTCDIYLQMSHGFVQCCEESQFCGCSISLMPGACSLVSCDCRETDARQTTFFVLNRLFVSKCSFFKQLGALLLTRATSPPNSPQLTAVGGRWKWPDGKQVYRRRLLFCKCQTMRGAAVETFGERNTDMSLPVLRVVWWRGGESQRL